MGRKRLLDETDRLVARNIRYQRIQRGMSQEAVAHELGLTFQQLQKYEKGVNRVSIGRLMRIAKILDVPLSLLLDGVEDSGGLQPSTTLSDHLSDRLAVRLIEAFSRRRQGSRWHHVAAMMRCGHQASTKPNTTLSRVQPQAIEVPHPAQLPPRPKIGKDASTSFD